MERLKPNTHQVHVERTSFGRSVDIHIAQFAPNGDLVAVAIPIELEKVDDGWLASRTDPPAISMQPELAQRLADELWQAGFRPTQGQQSEGQIAAVNSHLQDMRHMVAKLSKVPLPGAGGT